MCGGGGGSSAPAMPSPLLEAQAQIQVLQEQFRMDNERATQEREFRQQKETQDRSQFGTDVADARTRTRGAIDGQFADRGLNAMDYDSRINSALDMQQANQQFGSTINFGTDIGDNVMKAIRDSQIRENQQSVNAFAGSGFEQNAFRSTMDDSIIDAILGEQFGTASDSILRARDRGTLNDSGFRYAMDNLGSQRTAANSRLQDIGGGILEGFRGELGGIANNARTSAGNWDFGDLFDSNQYASQISTRQGELSSGLEGNIRNAIGGEQFFNTNDLIMKGGVSQGAQNTGLGSQSGGLLAAINARQNTENENRGLGSTGSF